MTRATICLAALAVATASGCPRREHDSTQPVPITAPAPSAGVGLPSRPLTGAPLAFDPIRVHRSSGPSHTYPWSSAPVSETTLDFRAYNFSDTRAVAFRVFARFRDAHANVVTLNPGGPHAKTVALFGFNDDSEICEPRSWCSMTVRKVNLELTIVSGEALAIQVLPVSGNERDFGRPLFDLDPDAGNDEVRVWPVSSVAPPGLPQDRSR